MHYAYDPVFRQQIEMLEQVQSSKPPSAAAVPTYAIRGEQLQLEPLERRRQRYDLLRDYGHPTRTRPLSTGSFSTLLTAGETRPNSSQTASPYPYSESLLSLSRHLFMERKPKKMCRWINQFRSLKTSIKYHAETVTLLHFPLKRIADLFRQKIFAEKELLATSSRY